MSTSITLDWTNENSRRRYPLSSDYYPKVNNEALADSVLLDALLICNATTPTLSRNPTKLISISYNKSNNTATLTFNQEAGSGSLGFTQTFEVNLLQAFPQRVINANGSTITVGDGLSTLFSGVASSITWSVVAAILLPTCVLDVGAGWTGVRSLSIGQQASPIITYNSAGTVLTFEQGVQFRFRNLFGDLSFEAGMSFGDPAVCSYKPGSVSETCQSLVSYINGVQPSSLHGFNLLAGEGTAIYEDPLNSRLYISLLFSPADVCPSKQTIVV